MPISRLPFFKLYPGDWLRNGLTGCSLAAQGLWIRMMILMHDSDQYGYAVCHSKIMTDAQIAKRCGCSANEFRDHIAELEGAGVVAKDGRGAWFSEEMAEQERIRLIRAEAGSKGGFAKAKGIAKGWQSPSKSVNMNMTSESEEDSSVTDEASISNALAVEMEDRGLPTYSPPAKRRRVFVAKHGDPVPDEPGLLIETDPLYALPEPVREQVEAAMSAASGGRHFVGGWLRSAVITAIGECGGPEPVIRALQGSVGRSGGARAALSALKCKSSMAGRKLADKEERPPDDLVEY